jgi:hypothetical protein|tara:strand:- start:819 stop:1250 length:432 start_codon:yes stop_codon:yes gene_type:complete
MDNAADRIIDSSTPIIWINLISRSATVDAASRNPSVVWIALTKDDVGGILDDDGDLYNKDPLEIVRERLEKMVEDGTLEIDRDYTVTGTAVMDVTMTHTVTARSVETARQAFYEAVQEIGPENMDDYEVDEVRDEDILDVSLD